MIEHTIIHNNATIASQPFQRWGGTGTLSRHNRQTVREKLGNVFLHPASSTEAGKWKMSIEKRHSYGT